MRRLVGLSMRRKLYLSQLHIIATWSANDRSRPDPRLRRCNYRGSTQVSCSAGVSGGCGGGNLSYSWNYSGTGNALRAVLAYSTAGLTPSAR